MSRGDIKEIKNLNKKFGANSTYLFCKIQEKYGEEEYWLLTPNELEEFMDRATTNIEDLDWELNNGEFTVVHNNWKSANEKNYYVCARLSLDGEKIDLLLTPEDLEGIRYRVSQNQEDIQANKEHWLFDLFD